MLNPLRDKNEGMYRSGQGGEEPALLPRIWITTKEGERQKGEDNKWDKKIHEQTNKEEKKRKKGSVYFWLPKIYPRS